MTTTNDGGEDTTNAGPVLPELPLGCYVETSKRGVKFETYSAAGARAYGLQCWNACAEHVAGPLRERIAELEREEEVTDHVIERTTRLLAECVVILRGPEPPLTKWSYHDIPQLVQALKADRDRLRAENEALFSELLKHVTAAVRLVNGIVQTRSLDCVDNMVAANMSARDLMAKIDAACAARETK